MVQDVQNGNTDQLLSGMVRVSHSRFNVFNLEDEDFSYSPHLLDLLRELGYNREEFLVLCKDFENKLVHPDDRKLYRDYSDKMQNGEEMQVVEIEYRMKKGDGRYLWVSSRDMVFERNADGKPTKILSSAINIDERKRLCQKIEENLRFLEKLSYKNSHEMRGPVATIKGLLDVAESNYENIKSETLLMFFKKCIGKLDDIIHEVNDELSDQSKQD